MRASTSYDLSKLVNEKVSEVLFDKSKNLQNFIRDRIMENPIYIKARDVAQKMIDDNDGDWNDLTGIGSTIVLCGLPKMNSLFWSVCSSYTTIERIDIATHFKRDNRFYLPLFNMYLDVKDYFNDVEIWAFEDYIKLHNQVSDLLKEFNKAVDKYDTVKEFRKNFNMDEFLKKFDELKGL